MGFRDQRIADSEVANRGSGAQGVYSLLATRYSPFATSSRRGLDRNHLERVHVAVLVADRDVFARHESMAREPVACLVVLVCALVIIEDPAPVLVAARLVHQLADLLLLVAPEPAHAAMLAMRAPQGRID